MIKPKYPKEKVVGILGGMGPYATLDFFKKILELTPAKKDWEHIRLLIDNNVKIPSRTRSILYKEESPVSYMVDSINNLASIGADFVAVPCNSAHYFYEKVSPSIKIPWINMIEIVSKNITYNKPLILGGYVTIYKKLYSNYIKEAVYLNDAENGYIYQIIEEIKLTGKLSVNKKRELTKIIKDNAKMFDSIILACTELPIVFHNKYLSGVKVINANTEYAKEVIKLVKRQN